MTDDIVQAVRARFDGRAREYDESAMHRELAAKVAAFVDLAGVTRVLDVATGTGLALRALRDRYGLRSPRMIGVDVSPGMLAVARIALPEAELIEADARTLPLLDDSVELVTCVTALHLIPDTPQVLSEWARVLRPGGTIVTATFAAFDPSRHRAPDEQEAPSYPQRHAEFATAQALVDVMAPAGLLPVRHEEWNYGDDCVLIAEFTTGQAPT